MSWFVIAILGHLANGVSFVIDKILLRSAFSRSGTYAGLVGALSLLTVVLIPWVDVWPRGITLLVAATSGITFVFALWSFFAALARAEASRVVPIVGSLIPMMTLAGAFVFVGEHLTDQTFLGFAVLICATILLSGGGKGKLTHETLWFSVASALLFACSSITGKLTYETVGFLGGLVSTRLFAALTAFILLAALDPQAGREVMSLFRPRRRAGKQQTSSLTSTLLTLIGQTTGAAGFMLVQWAIAKGSVSIVNALQAVQYAFLVIVALVLRQSAPRLLGEHLTRRTLILKSIALIMTALGMYLIA